MASDVTIDLKLITASFTQGMDQVNKSVSKTNLAIGNMVGSLAADVLKSFGSAAVSAFGSIFTEGKKLEQTTKIFATLTGSMENGIKVVNDLRAAAASTPFELDGLQSATKQLLTLNSVTADDVIPTLLKLGDVSAVGANDINGLATVFTKVQAQGRVTAETLESLILQSPILAQAMVEAAGVSGMGALRTAMAKGKIGADVLDLAITNVTSKGGIAFQAMAAQSKTLGGQISNLSDTFTNLSGDIGTNLLPIFKDLISRFATMIEANKDMITNMATSAFELLGVAASGALSIIESGVEIYKKNKTTIDFMATALIAGAAAYAVIKIATIAWATASTVSMASVATSARVMWVALTGPVGLAVAAFALLAAAVISNWQLIVDTFDKSIIQVSAFFSSLGDKITGFAATAAATLLNFAADAIESLGVLGMALSGVSEELRVQAKEYEATAAAAEVSATATTEEADEMVAAINKKIAARDTDAKDQAKKAETAKTAAQLKAEEDLARQKELDLSLLDLNTVFSEELAIRKAVEAELEAADAKTKLELLSKWLGEQEALKRLNEVTELQAKGKFIQAQELMDTIHKDAVIARIKGIFKERADTIAKTAKLEEKDRQDRKKAEDAAEKERLDQIAKNQKEEKRMRDGSLASFVSIEKAKVKWAKQTEVDKFQTLSDGFAAMSGLMKSENRTAFKIGQTAAIAQATMQTYQSATAAFASLAGIPVVGPGLGAVAAAGAIVAGLANIREISSQRPNFAQGGIVGGSSFSGDQIGANVNSAEMILNRQQQTQLFNMANGGSGGSDSLSRAIESLGNRIASMEITLIADDTELARSVSRGVQNGIIIGESR